MTTSAESLGDAFGAGEYDGSENLGSAARGGPDMETIEANSLLLGDFAASLGVLDTNSPDDGLGGTAQDPTTLTLTVWWVGGALPEGTDAERDPQFSDITLNVLPAERGHNEVTRMIEESGVKTWEGVWTTASRVDGSAAIVMHDPNVDFDGEAASEAIGLPVITVAEGAPASADSRSKDRPPLKGGAGIMAKLASNGLWNYCSTAFPVEREYPDGSKRYWMLSANHCAYNRGGTAIAKGAWLDYVGQEGLYPGHNAGYSTSFPANDLMLHRATFNLISEVYRGGLDSTTKNPIKGVQTSYTAGTFMRASGAMTGENTIRIKYDFPLDIVNEDCPPDGCILRYAEATEADDIAVGSGDSGGPVVVPVTGGVRAAGVINASNENRRCAPPRTATSTVCGNGIYFTDARTAIGTLNAQTNGVFRIPAL